MKEVFDCHSDIPSRIAEVQDEKGVDGIENLDAKDTVLEEEFLPSMRENRIMGRIAAVYLQDVYVPELALRRGLNQISYLKAEASLVDDVEVVESVSSIYDNSAEDTMSFLVGLEGVEPLMDNLDLLDTFYNLGVRSVGLTHSRRNGAGDGPFIFADNDKVNSGGLSLFGFDLINRMNELGIAVDTVHINEPGFWDIVDTSSDPIINSHSIPQEYGDIERNMSDEQMKAIAETGGVMSLNAIPLFHESWPDRPDMETIVDMVDYSVDVMGVDHVGFGFDFWGYLTHRYDDIDEDWSGVVGLEDDSDVGKLGPALVQRGYTEDEVEGLLWKNNLSVLEDIID